MNIKSVLQLVKLRSEAGVTGVEYALLGALFAVASLGSISAVHTVMTQELDDMTSGISAGATLWDTSSDDESGGEGGSTTTTSTTTTTTTTMPPTTTTTTTTMPPTTTTTTTMPPQEDPPVIATEGSASWRNKSKGRWRATVNFENESDEDVYLTIEIVKVADDGTTFTAQQIMKIYDDDDKTLNVNVVYKKNNRNLGNRIVSVVFRVISIDTKNSEGEDVTFETTEPVVIVDIPN